MGSLTSPVILKYERDLIMETKNHIIVNYAQMLVAMSNSVFNATDAFCDAPDINNSAIKTLNVLLESVRSQTVLLQQVLDGYGVG